MAKQKKVQSYEVVLGYIPNFFVSPGGQDDGGIAGRDPINIYLDLRNNVVKGQDVVMTGHGRGSPLSDYGRGNAVEVPVHKAYVVKAYDEKILPLLRERLNQARDTVEQIEARLQELAALQTRG